MRGDDGVNIKKRQAGIAEWETKPGSRRQEAKQTTKTTTLRKSNEQAAAKSKQQKPEKKAQEQRTVSRAQELVSQMQKAVNS